MTTSPPAVTAPATNSGSTGDTAPASGASSPAASAPDPASNTGSTLTPPQSAPLFYGVNGHNNEGGAYDISSTALQLSQLQDLGAKLYRNEVYSQGTANKLAGIAQTMAAGGVTVYPVMLMSIDIFNNETEGYNAGFALGQQTATSRHYPYYEVTNEMEAQLLIGNVDGVYPQQYDIAKFRKLRGVIRGMIAGIRSVDASGKIIMGGGTWLHYGFHQMLAAGMEPDGSIGHPVVDWDITAWHWYSEQGDITNACGGTGCHNVLAALKALGKPIWINEFGVRPNYGTDQQIAAYLVGNTMMAQFVALASTYDIESIQSYELYDDPVGGEGAFGLLKNDGFTQKPAYTAYKNFVATHPM
ncbi:glycoside hydrolase family protein [Caballeronia pedi]|uniref:glycoside hydrolase family protein n=1 Tax=Caballeronia pedi TaxID=1777141 RepID=UPI001FC92303|nr:glycoside hydrolase family protein [Caballeronia pedi]